MYVFIVPAIESTLIQISYKTNKLNRSGLRTTKD